MADCSFSFASIWNTILNDDRCVSSLKFCLMIISSILFIRPECFHADDWMHVHAWTLLLIFRQAFVFKLRIFFSVFMLFSLTASFKTCLYCLFMLNHDSVCLLCNMCFVLSCFMYY